MAERQRRPTPPTATPLQVHLRPQAVRQRTQVVLSLVRSASQRQIQTAIHVQSVDGTVALAVQTHGLTAVRVEVGMAV